MKRSSLDKRINLLIKCVVALTCTTQSTLGSASMGTVVLDGSRLPTDEGWSLYGVVQTSTDVSTDGSVVTLNTIGVDAGSIMAFYRDVGISSGFSIEFRLRVLEVSKPHNPYDAAIGFYTEFDWTGGLGSQRAQAVYFDEDSVGWGDNSQSIVMDTADAFHTYRLEVSPTGRAVVRIDGAVALQRDAFETNGTIAFGDRTNDPGLNGRFAIDYITVLRDCNQNDVPDEDDLAGGTSLDCNANGVPDQGQRA